MSIKKQTDPNNLKKRNNRNGGERAEKSYEGVIHI